MRKQVFLRADGNTSIGLGHVIRSLSIAEMLYEEFDCHFIIRSPQKAIRELILATCKSIIELSDSDDLLEEAEYLKHQFLHKEVIVVLDGYHFRTAYQKTLKIDSIRLVCIDDICDTHFIADAIINHGASVKQSDYSAEIYTKFYLGLSYAMLRKPFRKVAKTKIKREKIQNVMICFGGADPNNMTLKVLQKLDEIAFKNKIFIILGGVNKHKQVIKHFLNEVDLTYEILSNLGAEEMLSIMKKSAIAITAPSSISYEYLSVGGVLYLEVIAENQRKMFEYFISEHLAYKFKDFPQDNTNHEALIDHQKKYFDGQQKKRFLNIFQTL